MTLQELVNVLSNHLASAPPATPVFLDGSNFSVVVNRDGEENIFLEIKKV